MEKKKFTSWGVSFASLALVAGMMSYLGVTNKNTSSKTTTAAQSKTITQQSQSGNNQNSSITYEIPNQTADNSRTVQSSDQSSSADQSFTNQHGHFDTTTGGT
jgi:uncharacterized protein (UPF0333 family)